MADKGRWTREQAAKSVFKVLKHIEGQKDIEVCGSYRRGCEFVGDLDIVVVPEDLAKLTASIFSMAHKTLASGARNIRILLQNGMQVDFIIVKEEDFYSAVLHATGSKTFNIKCRARAKKYGLKLSEYGLRSAKTNKKVASTEEDILLYLKLRSYIPPEARSI